FLTALVITFICAPPIIAWLRRMKGHTIRKDTPTQHQTKAGTPAMGGLIIFLAIMGSCALWAKLSDRFILLFLTTCSMLWLLGFLDDFLKIQQHRRDGLAPSVKMMGQMMLALGVAAYLYIAPPNPMFSTWLSVPYSKEWMLHLGSLIIPFYM